MIRIFFSISFVVATVIAANACDGCGCSVSGGGVGLLNQSNTRYLGINYRYSLFDLSGHEAATAGQDAFFDWQLMGRIGFSPRIFVEASLPYRLIRRSGEGSLPVSENGIGDARILANYVFFNRRNTDERRQFFWSLGSGISLPTGSYNGIYDDAVPDHLNPGTGAWGWLWQSTISLQSGNWGINSRFGGQVKQRNQDDYRFGNQWTNSTLLFWQKKGEHLAFTPFVGMYTEVLENGERYGQPENPSTAGWGSFGTTGCEVKIGQVNLSAQVQIPVGQKYSAGEIQAKSRLSCTLAFLL